MRALQRGTIARAGMLAALAPAILGTPRAAAAAESFAGKTIELVVGNYPGGGFDIYARTLARHLGRHIPGTPAIVVKNLPGAGSAKAGHYVGVLAPKDGTSLGAVTPGAIVAPLLSDRPDTLFEPAKVTYLGTASSGTRICATFQTSPIKTFNDAMTHKMRLGGVATGDAVHDYAYLLKHTTGAQIDVIPGYKGTLDLALAMERGEIDGVCGWDWSSAKSQKPDWIRDHKLNLLAQIGPKPDAELTRMGVPPIWNYIKDPSARQVAAMVISQQGFSRPYFMPMGVPSGTVEMLRQAFDATMQDSDFLADADKMRIDISPAGGAEVQDLVNQIFATPKDVVERAKAAIRP